MTEIYQKNYENGVDDNLPNVTKISTPLFILYSLVTFAIYTFVKMFRMTGDINNLVPNKQRTPLIILIIYTGLSIFYRPILDSIFEFNIQLISILIMWLFTLALYCYIIYKNLNNLSRIAEKNLNKKLKYNRFWALLFGFVYINFVFNTYNQRLYEK